MDEKTKKYISIAGRPGKFGAWFHNKAYALLGLNNVYISLKVEGPNLASFIPIIRDNLAGCSVSMPHKVTILPLLDKIDPLAKEIGAVNTVTNINGRLKGYNTDYYGAKKAIEQTIGALKNKQVFMAGAGGVSCAIGHAVVDLGGELHITNRSEEKGMSLAKKLKCAYIPWADRNSFRGDFFINATCVGMDNEKPLLSTSSLNRYPAIMDTVIRETPLAAYTKRSGKVFVPGVLMTVYQAEKQFEIYTGEKLGKDFIKVVLEELLK